MASFAPIAVSNEVAEERVQEIRNMAKEWKWEMPDYCRDIYVSLSPDYQWALVYKFYREDRDDRYSSDIEKGDYYLLRINSDEYLKVMQHYTFYMNYNSYANDTQIEGTKVAWIKEDPCTLFLEHLDKKINLIDVCGGDEQEARFSL